MVEREAPSKEAEDLFQLAEDIASRELSPRVAEFEERAECPRELFRLLGRAGLLSLPYPMEYGGGEQPYEVYLQVLEILASRWAAVALGISVHSLACFPLATFGTDRQRDDWLSDMLSGEQLGAYCLSEPHAGSDPGALSSQADLVNGEYLLTGTKAWVTHGGVADFYNLFCRIGRGPDALHAVFLAPAETPGLIPQPPERKMGLSSSPTAQVVLDAAGVDPKRLIGVEGDGLRIALAALDSGRLGISAIATGVAQAALDEATRWALDRVQFGRRLADHQGIAFMLADMAVATNAARQTYLEAARRRDAGRPYSMQAAMAKLLATDTAMNVTTNAVQVLGGYGYTKDFAVERLMREAKVMQIFEGTNQIQRVVIGRHLASA